MKRRILAVVLAALLGATVLVARPAQAACLLNLCAIEGLLTAVNIHPSDITSFQTDVFGVETTQDGSVRQISYPISGTIFNGYLGAYGGQGFIQTADSSKFYSFQMSAPVVPGAPMLVTGSITGIYEPTVGILTGNFLLIQ